MTTKELTEVVTKHGATLAELNLAIAQLVHNSLILHDSIKSLETTALAHDAQIEELIEGRKSLEKEWQAYLRSRPSH